MCDLNFLSIKTKSPQTVARVRFKTSSLYRPGLWKKQITASLPEKCSSPQFSVHQIIEAKHRVFIEEHQPYSPDFHQCDIILFHVVKSKLKGTKFDTVDEVKAKGTKVMKFLMEMTCNTL
ncbi:hypothetical protein AVEN_46505-1 [Araneus ventricosus]|uniref:Histone-lysine N-methyltransferase SETMAR n=1 Tax=Araneus ventricosus TaxID=182803 RepID=A0A4Y2ESR6_ARAVE|nr:hypothetical protein AVEN_46505-1 [Araneus ventricosus]